MDGQFGMLFCHSSTIASVIVQYIQCMRYQGRMFLKHLRNLSLAWASCGSVPNILASTLLQSTSMLVSIAKLLEDCYYIRLITDLAPREPGRGPYIRRQVVSQLLPMNENPTLRRRVQGSSVKMKQIIQIHGIFFLKFE